MGEEEMSKQRAPLDHLERCMHNIFERGRVREKNDLA